MSGPWLGRSLCIPWYILQSVSVLPWVMRALNNLQAVWLADPSASWHQARVMP